MIERVGSWQGSERRENDDDVEVIQPVWIICGVVADLLPSLWINN